MHLDLLVISFILDVGLVGVPAGVTQDEGHTGFLHLPSAMLTLFFLAIRIQPFLSLVDREVEFRVLTNQPFSICCAFFYLFVFFFFLWGKMPFRVTARSTFVPLLIIAVFSLYEDHVVRTFSLSIWYFSALRPRGA